MNPVYLTVAVEDSLTEAIVRKTLAAFPGKYEVHNCLLARGFGPLKNKIRNYNQAARKLPFLVVTDLDDAPCAPELIQNWLPEPRQVNLLFRIAVREIEAWLLADREVIAKFFGFAPTLLPEAPDELADPKAYLLDTVRKKCRRRKLRESVVPAAGGTSKIGPDYNGVLGELVRKQWRPEIARQYSDSFSRTYQRLQNFNPGS